MAPESGLDQLREILIEAVAAVPWLARVASSGRLSSPVRVLVQVESGELSFATMHATTEEILDTWSYANVSAIRATPERMVAYATCVANVLARASADDRCAEMIPHPALLALPELVTAADFDRVRLDVDLEERAVEQLRRAYQS